MKPSVFTVAMLLAGLSAPAGAPHAQGSPSISADQQIAPTDAPYLFTSELGDFRVMMPGGCSEVRQRFNEKEPVEGETARIDDIQIVSVTCDRSGRPGNGCSVTAYLNLTDGQGGPAGEPQMTEQVGKYLERFGVEVLKQAQVSREFPGARRAQGIDLRCRAPESAGEFWLRGLVVDGDIYVLVAWNEDGGLWSDPDIVAFFDSFVPSLN